MPSFNPQYIFNQRFDLSPADKKVYKKYSNSPIQKITICRTPLDKKIGIALNVITLGQWQKAVANSGYDSLFHLFMIITLTNGVKLVFEKNESVRLRLLNPKGDVSSKTETMDVRGYGANSLTLQQLYDNGLASMGRDVFYTYKFDSLNCQHFINSILGASNLLTPELNTFIMQNLESIVNETPSYLRPLGNGITTFARKAREFFGMGLNLN